jgi:hypothetical protein
MSYQPQTFRGERIGWGPWRARWYSICSRHRHSERDCGACMAGRYVNDWALAGERVVCKFAYPLWYWWKNRPNSRSRRFLEHTFPGLRPDRNK